MSSNPMPKDGSLNAPATSHGSHPQPASDIQEPSTVYQDATLPDKTNRGSGTDEILNPADAVGPGIKPSNQPIPMPDGPDQPELQSSNPEGTGGNAQSTSVPVDYTGTKTSPTQNRRPPDGGVPVARPMGPTPK